MATTLTELSLPALVRRHAHPLQGTGGGSLNSYRPDEKKWRQVWTDSVNNLNDYSGGLDKGMMVLTGRSLSASGTATAVRMTYEAQPDGSVVQTGYGSTDDGKTWFADDVTKLPPFDKNGKQVRRLRKKEVS